MTIDIDVLEAATREMAKTQFEPNWRDKQDAARQLLIKSAPALISEHRRMAARIAELENEVVRLGAALFQVMDYGDIAAVRIARAALPGCP